MKTLGMTMQTSTYVNIQKAAWPPPWAETSSGVSVMVFGPAFFSFPVFGSSFLFFLSPSFLFFSLIASFPFSFLPAFTGSGRALAGREGGGIFKRAWARCAI